MSTFKFPNSLIVLEEKVIGDENAIFKWDGIQYSRTTLNQHHTLQSAFSNSVVWYYQRIIEKIGNDNMKEYLKKIGYGN